MTKTKQYPLKLNNKEIHLSKYVEHDDFLSDPRPPIVNEHIPEIWWHEMKLNYNLLQCFTWFKLYQLEG